MSFSSRLKEKQEQESRADSTTGRNRNRETERPVNAFLARRAEREREQQEQLKQAVQQDHSKEKTDFFRADREEARKLAQKLSASPNNKLSATPEQKLKNAGSPFAPIRQTPEQKAKVEEYTKYLAEKTKQERQRKQKREQEQQETKRILDKIGYQDGYQFKRYADLPNEPDFAQTVEKAKANVPSWMERAQFWKKTSNPVEDAYRQMEKMWGKDGATQGEIREKALKGTMGVSPENDGMFRKYALLTERERYTYDYVFEKAGREAADKYLDSLQDKINLRSAQDKYTRAETSIPEPLKIPYNIAKSAGMGVESAVRGIGHLPDAILGKQKDYAATESEYYQNMINNQAGGAEKFAYNVASGLGNLAPSIAIGIATGGAGTAGTAGTLGKIGSKLSAWAAKGAVGSGVMSAQTAGQTYRQDIMEGRPVEGARMNAALTAADEYVTNWLLGGIAAYGGGAVGKLLKNSKVGQAAKQGISNALAKNPSVRSAVLGAANYGGSMLSEGTQEAVQNLTESIRKSVIYGDDLNLKGDLTDPQTWEDFAMGAVTAGILNAPGAISNNRAINQYGKSINPDYRDYVNGLSDIKPESYADPADYQEATELKQMAEEYAARQANKEFVSNREKTEYALRFQEFMENTMRHNEEKAALEADQNARKTEETAEDGQTYTETETAEYEPYNASEEKAGYHYNAAEEEPAQTNAQNQTVRNPETIREPSVSSQEAGAGPSIIPNRTDAYRKPYGKNGQAALQEGYDGSIELSTYNKAFGRAYDAGYYNVNMDIAERSAVMSVLTNEQFVDAYKAGAQDYNMDHNIDLKTGQPKIIPQGTPGAGGLGTVSESATIPQRKVAEYIGKTTGLKINLVDGMGQASVAGSYGNGEITISINSNDFNGTLTHELTHHIKKYSPKGYRLYTEIAVEAIMKSENTSLENLMESYENSYAQAGQELTRAEIMDEVVADATQKFFNDPEFIDSIAKKDKTIAQRIVDFLRDVVDALKQLMKNGSTREAAKGLEEDLRYYEDARDAWMHALSDASETYKADKQGQAEGQKEQYALEKPELVTDESIEANYEKVREMDSVADLSGNEFEKGEKDLVTQVSDFYKSIGGKVHNEVVGDIYLDRDSVKDDIGHGVGRAKAIAFAAVPDILKNGYVLDYKKNWKNRGYDSAVIGAKVNITEGKYAGKYYGLAVVKLLDDNKMYLHEVHTTKAESVMPFKTPDLIGGKTRSDTYTLPPIYSIFNKLMNVNGENQPEKVKGQKEQYALEKPELVTDESMEANYKKVKDMKPVAELSGKEFPRGEKKLSEQVLDFFDSIGGKVHNDIIGEILLDKRAIKDDLAHGITDLKAIAFASVPDVLREGEVLDHQVNWKGRGYDSATVGAKVKIGGEEHYVLAVVKLRDKNRLYLHSVYTAKVGENAVIDQVFPSVAESTSGGNSLPIYSIFNKLMDVNGENQPEKIRLQLEDVDRAETDRRIEALLDENQDLRDAKKLLEKQFTLTPKNKVRQHDVEKVAKGLLEEYNSTYRPETLIINLDKLYEYIRSAEHMDSAQLTEAATSIAKGILKQSRQADTQMTQHYKDVRNQIKNTKIKISEQDKADMEASGGYNEFRKRNFGRMKLGNDGTPVDSLYQELSALHPELFPENITYPADQLVAISDALEQTETQIQNPYKANLDEMAYMVGQDILQSYFNVRQEKPTFADRKEAEIQKVRWEYSQKMREYKNNLKKQYEANLYRVRKENIQEIQKLAKAYKNLTETQQREQKEYYKKKMDDLRNEKNQALAAMQQRNREQTKRVRENQRAREAKKIIMKEAKTMQTWLLKPTDTKHIPEEIRTVVAEFLSNIDFSSNELNNNGIPTQRTMAWMAAKNAFAKIIEQGGIQEGKDGSRIYMEIDPDLAERIDAIAKKAEGVEKLDNLDVYHMEELKKVVLSMKKAITEANTLKSNKRSGQLSILANGVFSDLQNRKNHSEYLGVIGTAEKMLNYDMLDAQTMFGKLGDNFKSLYNSLREGLDKKTIKLKNAQDHVEKLLKDHGISYKTLREWTGSEAKPSKYKTSGGTIELTISQVMSLYELNKRNQARTHMYERTGGIIPAPRVGKFRIEDGKLILPKIEKAYRETKVTEADIARIINTLTPEQKALADGMQRFMGDDCAAWGNEVSMQMYGYMKYTTRNYFPITVYDNHIHTEQGNLKNQQRTIKNLGFTKSTVEKANKPIVIEDIFDVYSRQVDQMSTYNAYVIPLSDLNKVFNYVDMRNDADGKSIKEEIERTYGKEGNKYIDKLIADINGSLNKDKNLWDKLSQNMKVASVAGNIRVALQQPTAYIRASMEIDAKYLGRGALTMTRQNQWDIICKYAPIAQWKDWGFYRMDNSRQIKDVLFQTDSKMNKINNAFMILAEKGDKFAWNRIWRACEFECMDKHPELSIGTEAFYTEVGKRFSEVIDKTQVVDSVLHRTQIMRSERDSHKMLTAFMGEPLKTYNMLYREASDVAIGKKGAKGRMAKAVTVYTAAALVTSMAAAIQDAMRDDDRDKKWIEKYWDNVWRNFKDNMNPINSIPYVKDAYGVIFDGYTPNRPDIAAYQDLARAINRVRQLADGESNLTPQAVMADVIQSSCKLFGSPVKSASRDVRALVDTAINEFGSDSEDYIWLKQKYAIGSKENLSLYIGMMIEAQRNGNKALEKKIKTDLNEAGIDNKTISNRIKSTLKKELVSKDHIDPRIETAAQAKMGADTEAYKAAVSELIAEGYTGKLVTSVVDSRINQLSTGEEIDWEKEIETDPDELYGEILTGEEDEEEWSIYSSRDILEAVEQIDNTAKSLDAFKAISDEIIDSKTKAGKTKAEAISSIKSSITRVYKEKWIAAYLEGDRKGYEAIQAKLNVLRVDRKNLYSGTDYLSWRKSAKEREKEENADK